MPAMHRPASGDIAQRQNSEANLRRQAAARSVYRRGKQFHFAGSIVALLIALASPIVLLKWPDFGPLLGAIGGLWIFVSRIALEPLKEGCQSRGARMQELFDTDVLGLDQNDALGTPISEEEVRKHSKNLKNESGLRDWYPMEDVLLSWPASALVCQRSNAVWARRQHQSYGVVLAVSALVWGVAGVIFALSQDSSLAQYLTTLALPSLPALLDAVERSKEHFKAVAAREQIEGQVDTLIRSRNATEADLREIQDILFELRRTGPLIPDWFYKVIRPNYETGMKYAAERVADLEGSTIQDPGES